MAIEKRPSSAGKVSVTFRVPADVSAAAAELVGEFTEWSPIAMTLVDGGEHVVVLDLDAGVSYRFRYRLDGDRWVNDWAADRYVPNDYGSDDSVVDLTAVGSMPEVPVEPAPKSKRTRTPRKAAAGASTDTSKAKAAKVDADTTKSKRAPRRKSSASTD